MSTLTSASDLTISETNELKIKRLKIKRLKILSKDAKKLKYEIKHTVNFLNKVEYDNTILQLILRVSEMSKIYTRMTQKIYELKKELGYLTSQNEKTPIVRSDKCLYKTPEVVGRMVEIDVVKADLTNTTTDEFIIGYITDCNKDKMEYLIEIPELLGKLHDGTSYTNLKLTGGKYWYCTRDWFEFVD